MPNSIEGVDYLNESIDLNNNNPILFANKKSSIMPSLAFPINNQLHKLLRDVDCFNIEIAHTINKIKTQFKDFKLVSEVITKKNPASSSTNNESILYFKIQLAFLHHLQQQQQRQQTSINFTQFLTGLITGYGGQTSNLKERTKNHKASSHLYLTISTSFLNINEKANKVGENILFKLLNLSNMDQNKQGAKVIILTN